MLHQEKILVDWRGIWDDMLIAEGWDDDSLQELELVKQENSQLSSYKRQVLMLDQEKKDLETQLVQVKVSFVI